MSSANPDLVRSVLAAWERGDWSSAGWADPEIEFVYVGGTEPGDWIGLIDMAEAWRAFLSNWEDFRIEVEEYRDLDSERVLVLVHNTGRGKRSGIDIEQIAAKFANLFHIRDGKVTKLVCYWDRKRALADLGLATDSGSAGS